MNAKQEFINHTSGKKVKCAFITNESYYNDCNREVILKVNYSEPDYQDFLKKLDFNYDDGYGGQ